MEKPRNGNIDEEGHDSLADLVYFDASYLIFHEQYTPDKIYGLLDHWLKKLMVTLMNQG